MAANTRDEAGVGSGGRRRRRAWGAVEQLPSGRFRARMVAPDGVYVSAPTTFTSRTDAAVWLDLQHADMVRGVWRAPRRSTGPAYTVGEYVARWIEQHPRAKDSTKELYRGLLRGCIGPDIGTVPLTGLTPDAVRSGTTALVAGSPPTSPLNATGSHSPVGRRARRRSTTGGPARPRPTDSCGRRWPPLTTTG